MRNKQRKNKIDKILKLSKKIVDSNIKNNNNTTQETQTVFIKPIFVRG